MWNAGKGMQASSGPAGVLAEKPAVPASSRRAALAELPGIPCQWTVFRLWWPVWAALLLPFWSPILAGVQVIHDFRPTDGRDPLQPRLVYVEAAGRWYGTASNGGMYDKGILFRLTEDGSEYTILHHFGGPGDSAEPVGSLIFQDGGLFSVSRTGGSTNRGTLFRADLSGNCTILHQFTGGSDGATPVGLSDYGNILYGTTSMGGAYGGGTLFKVNTGGGGYAILFHFGSNGKEKYPSGAPLVEVQPAGVYLYGFTSWLEHWPGPPISFDYYVCSMYKIKEGTGEYQQLCSADGHATGKPVLSGSFLYGLHYNGISKTATDGSSSVWLYRFDEDDDGFDPEGSLLLSGIYLYGMTTAGGPYGKGTIFRISTSGLFRRMKVFAGGSEDGAAGIGALNLRNGFFYGCTADGGYDDRGTVFRIDTDGGRFALLHRFANDAGICPKGDLLASDGWLYGMTRAGGRFGQGTIFRITPDGSACNLLHHFGSLVMDGTFPEGELMAHDGWLYGMTSKGGLSNYGVLFKMKPDGSEFTFLNHFGSSGDGREPDASVVEMSGSVFGTTQTWGANGAGMLFKLTSSGTYLVLRSFTFSNTDGAFPAGTPVSYNGKLYGMTNIGGEANKGTVYNIRSYGDFTLMKSFTGADGAGPIGSLTPWGGVFYGMTCLGGDHNGGTIFKINTGGTHTLLHSFDGATGEPWSNGTPAIVDGIIYGMTREGGAGGKGTIFRFAPEGSGYARLHSFSGTDGANPYGSLIVSGDALYGMTSTGGNLNRGTVFRLPLHPVNFSRNGSGSLDGLTSQHVADGDSTQPVTAAAGYGYRFVDWTGTGGFSSDDNPLVIGNITGPMDITANFVIDPFLTVKSPNGGEAWLAGSTREITWRSNGPISNIKIEYSINSGTGWAPVAASTPNDGSFSWQVPMTLSPFCLIRISDVAAPAVSDASDAVFAITDASLTVTSPNGSETWLAGSVQPVTWTSTGAIANVKIEYSTTSRASWHSLVDFTPNTGSFPWTVGGTVSSLCKIRISDAANPAVTDLSDNPFTITEYNPPDTEITSELCGKTAGVPAVAVTWTGNDDCTGRTRLKYSWKLDSGGWSEFDSSRTQLMGWLVAGPHTVYVRARDEAGNVDPSPAECTFTVELEELPGDVTRDGRVDVEDLLVMELAQGDRMSWRFRWICREAGDLNGNGRIDPDDCQTLARYLAEQMVRE